MPSRDIYVPLLTIISVCSPVNAVVCENPLLLGEELGGTNTIGKDKVCRNSDKDSLCRRRSELANPPDSASEDFSKSSTYKKSLNHKNPAPRAQAPACTDIGDSTCEKATESTRQ